MQRILIADDDTDMCAVLSRVLSDEGYGVETTPDGRTALARVAAVPPDLLITDLLMPGLTGWSVYARVRRREPTLPIIVISGSDSGSRRPETLLPGDAAFLRKPFALDQLLATVARLLAGTPDDRMP